MHQIIDHIIDNVNNEITLIEIKSKLLPYSIQDCIETSMNLFYAYKAPQDTRADESYLAYEDEPVSLKFIQLSKSH